MANRMHDRSLLEPLKHPPLQNRGFDERLRTRILREVEAGVAPTARKRIWPAFVCMLAGVTALFAVLLVKPQTEPELAAGDQKPVQGEVEILQHAVPPPHEWADGFLIGLKSVAKAEKGAAEYRTLWIAPDSGSLRLLAEGDGLLVPYGPDFWLVDDDDFGAGHRLFARRIPIGNASSGSLLAPSLRVKPADAAAGPVPGEAVVFAGQSFIVLERETGGTLERLVTDLESLAAGERRSVPLSDMALLSADEAPAGETWTVVRHQGRWAVRTTAAIVPLNRQASVHDGLCLPWADIVDAVPDAEDAFCSPGANWIAVMTGDSLVALPVREDGTLGGQALNIALRPEEKPVMAEWATGGYVAKWTAFLTGFFAANGP